MMNICQQQQQRESSKIMDTEIMTIFDNNKLPTALYILIRIVNL